MSLEAVVEASSPNALAEVGGVKLLERVLFALGRAGVREVEIILPPACAPALSSLRKPQSLRVEISSELSGSEHGTGPILVLVAHLLISPGALRSFIARAPRSLPAQAESGGRTLPLAICSREQGGRALTTFIQSSGQPSLQGASTIKLTGSGAAALLCNTSDDLARAEGLLIASLGRPDDGFLTRLVDRRISQAITKRLAKTSVTPTAVTLLSVALGIVAGAVLSWGGYLSGLVGCSLFLASTIIDGCDGELARLKFQESRLGAWLDIAGDNVVHLAVFGGLGLGLYREHPGLPFRAGAALLIAGILVAMATTYWCIFRHEPAPAQRRLFNAFASREFAYLMVILAATGRLHWFFWLATAGSFVFSTLLFLLGKGKRRQRQTSSHAGAQ